MSLPQETAHRDSTLAKYRWPIALVAAAAVLVLGVFLLLWEIKRMVVEGVNAAGNQSTNLVHAIGQEAANALGRFTHGTITRTFTESAPQLVSDPGGRLEIASLTMSEIFSESNNLVTGWGKLDLGSTVTEIKVPATYGYYVRLRDKWVLDVQSNICIVQAPRIHPSLPPAIDTGKMEKFSSEGWGRFNATAQMDMLERDITPTLAVYASDAHHIALVREECRKTTAQFVRDWLLREQQWGDGRFTAVKVVFADEKATNILDLPASVELKAK